MDLPNAMDKDGNKRFSAKDFPGNCNMRSFFFPKTVAKEGTRNVFPIFVNEIGGWG